MLLALAQAWALKEERAWTIKANFQIRVHFRMLHLRLVDVEL